MPLISIDYDPLLKQIYLAGDIKALKKHRYAWNYFKGYHPIEDEDFITIDIGDNEPVEILSKINDALKKYGFECNLTDSSERIIIDFREEEEKFAEFSKKAYDIRENHCDSDEFKKFEESVKVNMPYRQLYPLQLLSSYHMAFSQNACNFSVPGSGKTSIVYGAYAYLHNLPDEDWKHIDRILVIGPLSSFAPWEMEYQECFGHHPTAKRLITGLTKEQKQNYLYSRNPAELTLISYAGVDSLKEELNFFLRNNKTMVILDEAHKIKNTSGRPTAQAVLGLAKFSRSRIVLTGTPAPNGYEDLYNLFKFIWPTRNVTRFEVNQLRDMTARGDSARVDKLIKNISPYFIRIKKSDLNIPPATVHAPIYVPMGKYQQIIYSFIEKKYMDAMINDRSSFSSSALKSTLTRARIIRLMQAATDPSMLKKPLEDFMLDDDVPREAYQAIDDTDILKLITEYDSIETPPKFVVVKDLVEQIISSGGKVVIWATFVNTIFNLKKYLEANGIICQELYGGIPVQTGEIEDDPEDEEITRERIIQEFMSPECPFKVIIANPHAVAESISLHKACHNAIYIERSFNAAHYVQSKDRIHRYGLKEGTETHYYFVLSKDSIDETINERLDFKEERMTEIMERMPIPLFDNVMDGVGDDDIKAIIRDYVKRTKKP